MPLKKTKVTKSLRRTWGYMKEDCVVRRAAITNPASDTTIEDFEIRVLDALLELPLGTMFNAQEVAKELTP